MSIHAERLPRRKRALESSTKWCGNVRQSIWRKIVIGRVTGLQGDGPA